MTILGFPNRPVQDRVMIMLCLGLDAFSVSWHSGLSFPLTAMTRMMLIRPMTSKVEPMTDLACTTV
jgi:hypothetical protein